MVNFSLMQYRAMPHKTLGESPAYMTHGTDLVLRNSDYELANAGLSDLERNRLQVLAEFRQRVIQNYYNMLDSIDKESPAGKTMKLGDLVIIHLTDKQRRNYAACINSSIKLASEWTLPMRVIRTNLKGTTRTVECVVTGTATTVHVDRVRFL